MPIGAELVATISAVDGRLDVRYEPDLYPSPHFSGNHGGIDGFPRPQDQDQDQETRKRRVQADAEVVFEVPGGTAQGLADLVPNGDAFRWVQSAEGDAGEQVQAAGLTGEELDRVLITGVGAIHAGPLAEFAMFGLLAFAKQLPRLPADTRSRRCAHTR